MIRMNDLCVCRCPRCIVCTQLMNEKTPAETVVKEINKNNNKADNNNNNNNNNKAAAYLHWNIYQDHDIEVIDKWYEHKPESVTHNKDSKITIMWDMSVNTDRTITANRPDIIIKDSVNSTCKLIDMSILSDRNIALNEIEKKASTKT